MNNLESNIREYLRQGLSNRVDKIEVRSPVQTEFEELIRSFGPSLGIGSPRMNNTNLEKIERSISNSQNPELKSIFDEIKKSISEAHGLRKNLDFPNTPESSLLKESIVNKLRELEKLQKEELNQNPLSEEKYKVKINGLDKRDPNYIKNLQKLLPSTEQKLISDLEGYEKAFAARRAAIEAEYNKVMNNSVPGEYSQPIVKRENALKALEEQREKFLKNLMTEKEVDRLAKSCSSEAMKLKEQCQKALKTSELPSYLGDIKYNMDTLIMNDPKGMQKLLADIPAHLKELDKEKEEARKQNHFKQVEVQPKPQPEIQQQNAIDPNVEYKCKGVAKQLNNICKEKLGLEFEYNAGTKSNPGQQIRVVVEYNDRLKLQALKDKVLPKGMNPEIKPSSDGMAFVMIIKAEDAKIISPNEFYLAQKNLAEAVATLEQKRRPTLQRSEKSHDLKLAQQEAMLVARRIPIAETKGDETKVPRFPNAEQKTTDKGSGRGSF